MTLTDEGYGRILGAMLGAMLVAIVTGVAGYFGGQQQMNGKVFAAQRGQRTAERYERSAQVGHHQITEAWISCEVERRQCIARCGE